MTVTPPGMPGSQYGAHTPNFQPTPPSGPVNPVAYPTAPTTRGSKLATVGTLAALLVAIAALVVAIIAVNRPNSSQPNSAPPTTTSTPTADSADADRALCTAIAPLMGEIDHVSKTYVGLGEAGSPARDGALPKYVTDVENWIARIQPIVDSHPEANSFLRRSLQRFIDDQHLLVSDLAPGPLTSYAKSLWSDSLGAYSGPLHACDQLGIKW